METLRQVFERAGAHHVAIGHFNVSGWVALQAVFQAARDLGVPVVVGASEGERRFLGVCQLAAVVSSLREEHDFPIFLNADHTHSLSSVWEAAKAGFDWIVFDASALPFNQNIRATKEAVAALKAARLALFTGARNHARSTCS
jgi:fructose-bisphosphate aldolase, class II